MLLRSPLRDSHFAERVFQTSNLVPRVEGLAVNRAKALHSSSLLLFRDPKYFFGPGNRACDLSLYGLALLAILPVVTLHHG